MKVSWLSVELAIQNTGEHRPVCDKGVFAHRYRAANSSSKRQIPSSEAAYNLWQHPIDYLATSLGRGAPSWHLTTQGKKHKVKHQASKQHPRQASIQGNPRQSKAKDPRLLQHCHLRQQPSTPTTIWSLKVS